MTFKADDRIYETSTTSGTGDLTLAGAVTGFQSFASLLSSGDTFPYFLTDDTNWEVGIGTYATGPSRLQRTTILSSSNSDAAVNWSGSTIKCRVGLPAAMAFPRRQSKSVAGSSDVTLTQNEQRCSILELTGALTGNISVIVDATVWAWEVYNNTTGAFRLILKVSGQTGVEIPQGQRVLAYCDGTDVRLVAPPVQGMKNMLINPDGRVAQRTLGSTADDTYCFDRWYALTQSGAVTASQQTDVANGTPFMMRILQAQASAQRMGLAQIIEGKNCKHARGRAVTLSGKVRCSASQAIRYAIVEHTGTEDSVTSDIVNDWTSSDYGDGAAKFFVDANLTPVATGSITPSAATLTAITPLTGNLSGSLNNLIVFVWTEGTAAQNVTLDVALQLELGSVATEFEFRDIGYDREECERWLYIPDLPHVDAAVLIGFAISTTQVVAVLEFPVTMRVAPTLATSGSFDLTDGASGFSASSVGTLGALATNRWPALISVSSGLTQFRPYYFRARTGARQLVFSCEL